MLGDRRILFSISTLLCSQSPSVLPQFPKGHILHLHRNHSAVGLCQTLCRDEASAPGCDRGRHGYKRPPVPLWKGRAESDGETEWSGGVSPASREQGHVALQVRGPRKRRLHASKAVLHHVRTGAVPGQLKGWQSPASRVYPGSQAGAANASLAIGAGRAHLHGSGLCGIHSALGFRHPETPKFRSVPAIACFSSKASEDGLSVPETQSAHG